MGVTKKGRMKELSRQEIWLQLANAISLRSSQDQVLWSIFGVFWAANSILFVALFTTGNLPASGVGIIISGIGIFMSTTWLLIQRRALRHIQKHEGLMKRLETNLFKKYNKKYAINNEEDYHKYLAKGPKARTVMPWTARIFVLMWFLFLIGFGWSALALGRFF